MIDLIKILIFLSGSAALGFILGRRSRNSDVAVRDHQVEEQRRAYGEVKSKLERCTAKRANLEREMAQIQRAKPTEKKTTARTASPATPVKTTLSKIKAPATPSVKPPTKASPKSAEKPEVKAKAKSPVPPKNKAKPKAKKETKSASAKQDEAITRVKAKAEQIDFNRIGKASEAEKDDLKRIKGVGPFLEKKLNALGIYTFAQVANFTDEDKDKVNDAIEFFPGRISRDDWVGQAKKLR
ncbi:MAG: hypothetical protein ACFB15_00330 [Cyclobacteriaceae bacterium]